MPRLSTAVPAWAALLLASACGRFGFDETNRGAPDAADAAPDVIDEDASTSCFDRWKTGAPPLSTPQLVLDDGANEIDPRLSPDGLRLYYATNRDGPIHTYATVRPSLDGNYQEVGIASEFPTVDRVNVWFLEDDVVYATDKTAADDYDIELYTRNSPAESFTGFDDPGISVMNSLASERVHLCLARHAHRVLRPFIGSGDFDIFRSTRPSSSVAWGTPVAIPNLAAVGVAELDPYLTPDGLTMLYSALSPARQREYITTRASTSDEFTPGVALDLGSGAGADHDGVLSPNGCEIYFASTRLNGNESLFRALVLP